MTELRQRQPRIAEPQYLAWLRKQGCSCGCKSPPPSDAAHLRTGSLLHDKRITGMARKPDDRWALPLRHDHHMAQHRYGSEVEWWNMHNIDPFARAMRYHAAYMAERPQTLAGALSRAPPRTPKSRAKTRQQPRQQRSRPKKSRKIASRGFAKGKKRKFGHV